MKHILLLSLTAVLLSALGISQDKAKDLGQGKTQLFANGDHVRLVTIKTREGALIASMEVPKNIYLSVYADKEVHLGSKYWEFSGSISIRTKPESEMKQGIAAEQMASDVVKLDFPDAVVTVKGQDD